MRDAFSGYHPLVNCIWFAAVLAYTMLFMHPVMLAVALACAVAYSLYLTGRRAARVQAAAILPLMLLTAVLNPLFNHRGVTILCWLPGGNPLTLEAVVYGIAAAGMLAAAISWFYCLNRVFTTDKLVWLFGRIIPFLSLLVSMTLRFVPQFTARARAVAECQRDLRGREDKKLLRRAANGLRVLSIVITWALENAIHTADSMKSRGYGLPGRTAFSLYRFSRRDGVALGATVVLSLIVGTGAGLGGIHWEYYPGLAGEMRSPLTLTIFAAWLALCALPLILNLWEACQWKALRSGV